MASDISEEEEHHRALFPANGISVTAALHISGGELIAHLLATVGVPRALTAFRQRISGKESNYDFLSLHADPVNRKRRKILRSVCVRHPQ